MIFLPKIGAVDMTFENLKNDWHVHEISFGTFNVGQNTHHRNALS